jgi:hypothetical protein
MEASIALVCGGNSARSRRHNASERRTAVPDHVALRSIGFALSGIAAIVIAVAAFTVSASIGVPL